MPELLQYIFYWIAIFAFITFAYRHAFYSRLLILKIFPEQVMFWPFRMPEYQMLFVVGMNLACSMFITIMIISLQKTIKNYCHRTDLKNKNGSLRLHGGFFLCFCVLKKYTKTLVINLNTREHFVTLPRHLPSWAVKRIRFFRRTWNVNGLIHFHEK